MKIRNIIKSLLLSLVVVFAASCDKKLDVDPRQSIDAADALTTPGDVEGAVAATANLLAVKSARPPCSTKFRVLTHHRLTTAAIDLPHSFVSNCPAGAQYASPG
jgi:hypothetical protein